MLQGQAGPGGLRCGTVQDSSEKDNLQLSLSQHPRVLRPRALLSESCKYLLRLGVTVRGRQELRWSLHAGIFLKTGTKDRRYLCWLAQEKSTPEPALAFPTAYDGSRRIVGTRSLNMDLKSFFPPQIRMLFDYLCSSSI